MQMGAAPKPVQAIDLPSLATSAPFSGECSLVTDNSRGPETALPSTSGTDSLWTAEAGDTEGETWTPSIGLSSYL